MEEDSLDGTERCVILDPPSSSEADVAGEEVVHIKEQLVSTELWENLGELASQLPDALAAEEERKRWKQSLILNQIYGHVHPSTLTG